eukprot:6213457-Pleurochrysis_carterae.AAC.2
MEPIMACTSRLALARDQLVAQPLIPDTSSSLELGIVGRNWGIDRYTFALLTHPPLSTAHMLQMLLAVQQSRTRSHQTIRYMHDTHIKPARLVQTSA